MTKYHVYILTNQNIAHTSYLYGKKSLYVSVSESNPYDRLSKRFKRFTHTIEYPQGKYNLEDYFIEVYDPNRHFYKYLIKFNKPLFKLLSVEFFFSLADKTNNTPLILAFHQENHVTIYYTANFLYYYTSGLFAHKVKDHYLPEDSKFYNGDLVTRLLEELSLYLNDYRKDKLVILTDLIPRTDDKTYPLTGPNKRKITVRKPDRLHQYFYKYTHKINNASNDSGFYIAYLYEAIFVELNRDFKKLTYVNVYYNIFDKIKPILFELKFAYGSKKYGFSQFENDLKTSQLTKKVGDLSKLDDTKLYNELINENDIVYNYVTYSIEKKTEYTYQVTVTENKQFHTQYGFNNYTHKPFEKYIDKRGNLVLGGSKLLKWKTFGRLAELYDEKSVVFESVDVYFSNKKTDFPLVVKITKKGQFSNNPDFFVHKKSSSLYFWDQLFVRSGKITDEILVSNLKKTDFDLVKPIVLLLERRNDYSYRDIVYGVAKSEAAKDFTLIEVDPNGIKAVDKTETLGNCIGKKHFKVVEHDLSSFVKLKHDLGLRFFVINNNTNQYSALTLYTNETDPSDGHEEYIYYNPSHTSVYVYFYSEYNMPLMLCYGNHAYKPINLELYSEKWVKVHELTNYLCSDPQVRDKGSLLLSTLEAIVKSLNLASQSRVSELQKHTSSVTTRPSSIPTGHEVEVLKTPAQKTPKTVVPEVLKTVSYDIDLSKTTASSYGHSDKITVSNKNSYPDLDLFCYFTHTSIDKTGFNISSFKTSDRKNISVDTHLENVTSVNVYFNIFNTNNPIMLEISQNSETKYYIKVLQDNQTYQFSSLVKVQKEEIIYKMITENDRVNSSVTYQLEKSFKSDNNMYGHNNSIKVTKNVKKSNDFTIYTHQPTKEQVVKSYVLWKNNLVVTNNRDPDPKKSDIQNKEYKNLNVFVLDTDPQSPLIMELNGSQSKTTYVCKNYGSGSFWEKESMDSSDDKIYSKLREINYPLKKSVIIDLDKNNNAKYQMKLIDNTLKNNDKEYVKSTYKEGEVVSSVIINVEHTSDVLDRYMKSYTDYKLFSHTIPDNVTALGVAGIRFFVTRSSGSQPEEITLYESETHASQPKNKLFFHYPPKSGFNKIYGYFYGSDSRPLLLCYDGHLYKRLNINDNSKWILAKKTSCSDSAVVIQLLMEIHKTMKRKLTFLKTGDLKNITISLEENVGSFKRIRYTADTQVSLLNNSFTLPQSEIIKQMSKTTSIKTLLLGLNDRQFDTVNIYYEGSRTMTFLCEFIDDTVKTHFQRVDKAGEYWIQKRVEYKKESDLPSLLTKITSGLNSTVVYEIDKTITGYNASIEVVEDMSFRKNGFTKYTHSSKDGTAKYSLILCLKEELKKKERNEIVIFSKIQNTPSTKISVYFGSKAKEKPSARETIPLVFELFSGVSDANSTTFYNHRRDANGKYWELARHVSGGDKEKNVMSLLKQTQFDFLKSLVILTDFKTTYGEKEMKLGISKLNVKGHIFEANIDNNSLTVVEKERPECLRGSGFKYREYNIDRIKQNEWYGLRFFVQTDKSNIYGELTLNNSASFYQEFLYHKKDESDDKVYVFFYGEDPRPLVLCYRKSAYRPMKLNEYFDRWYKDSTVWECCREYGDHRELLEALSNVTGFLNEVQLEQKPTFDMYEEEQPNNAGRKTSTYDVQTFNGQKIKIEVSYENKSCYRVYSHKPNGTGSNGSGFRLGNILYNRKQGEGLNYEMSKQLKAVNVYYYVYDYGHEYPLLVSLEFKEGSNNEYYELDDIRVLKWRRINESVDRSNIEYTIKAIIKTLKLEFDTGDQAQTLFYSNECYDDSSNTTLIAAASGGTVTTAALVGGGVTLATHPEWVVPVIRALV